MTAFRYSEWRPAPLSGTVDFLWHFEGPTSHRRKRVLPNGKVEVLVNLGEPYRKVEGRGLEILREGCLSGMQSEPVVLEQPSRQNVLGVRLLPAGARALLAAPVRESSGWMLGLSDVFGRAALELWERCHEASEVSERFRILAGWIHRRIERAPAGTPEIAWSAARIARSHGGVPIGTLRRETGFPPPSSRASSARRSGFRPSSTPGWFASAAS